MSTIEEWVLLYPKLKENGFIDLTRGFKNYVEFFFIYRDIIIDFAHKTIQSDGADVVGGTGKSIKYNDFIEVFTDWEKENKHLWNKS